MAVHIDAVLYEERYHGDHRDQHDHQGVVPTAALRGQVRAPGGETRRKMMSKIMSKTTSKRMSSTMSKTMIKTMSKTMRKTMSKKNK